MNLIAHRGNITGRIEEDENRPQYIDDAISMGYDVEIDIRKVGDDLFLGHDTPQYKVDYNWLIDRKDKLWIHCKNVEAMEWFDSNREFNYFWHEKDTVTLTSNGSIWAFPGKQPIKNSIAILPEIFNDNISQCRGICSDYIQQYKTK
jgi:hypothetical protein